MQNELVISGYALTWDETPLLSGCQLPGSYTKSKYIERFERGAFTESIKEGNQKLLIEHKKIYEVEGSLIFLEDETGLAFRAELKNDEYNRMVYNAIRNREIKHVSVGFRNTESEITKLRHYKLRTITKVDLLEISLLNDPAYKTSCVQVGCDNTRLNLQAKINRALKV